jgi:hypothetical protein
MFCEIVPWLVNIVRFTHLFLSPPLDRVCEVVGYMSEDMAHLYSTCLHTVNALCALRRPGTVLLM